MASAGTLRTDVYTPLERRRRPPICAPGGIWPPSSGYASDPPYFIPPQTGVAHVSPSHARSCPMKIAKAVILADSVGRPAALAGGGFGHQAPVPCREPADPLPPPRERFIARGCSRRRSSSILRARDADRPRRGRRLGAGSSPSATSEWTPAPSGSTGALAACALVHRRGAGARAARPTRSCASRLNTHIAAFSDERLDAMALQPGLRAGARRRASCRRGYLLSPRALVAAAGVPPTPRRTRSTRCASRAAASASQPVDGCLPCHGDLDAPARLQSPHARAARRPRPTLALLDGCEVQGPVIVHPSAEVRRSTLARPAHHRPGRAADRRLRRPLHLDPRGRDDRGRRDRALDRAPRRRARLRRHAHRFQRDRGGGSDRSRVQEAELASNAIGNGAEVLLS